MFHNTGQIQFQNQPRSMVEIYVCMQKNKPCQIHSTSLKDIEKLSLSPQGGFTLLHLQSLAQRAVTSEIVGGNVVDYENGDLAQQ